MLDFKKIDEARKLLGLEEEASMQDIKDNFRELALKYHPDRHKGTDKKHSEALFKRITHAKDILERYCAGYRYSFREKDVRKYTMTKEQYEHLKRFYDDFVGDPDL